MLSHPGQTGMHATICSSLWKKQNFLQVHVRLQHTSAQATRSECRAFTGGRMSTDAMSSLDCTGFRRVTASTTSVLMMLMHTSAAPRTCPRACRLVRQGPPSLTALELSRGIRQKTMQLVSLKHLYGQEHLQQTMHPMCMYSTSFMAAARCQTKHGLLNPGPHRTKPRPKQPPSQGHMGAPEHCASGGHTLRQVPILASNRMPSRAPCGPPRCLRAPALRV